MKINKAQLKSLIKECLIEILTGDTGSPVKLESKSPRATNHLQRTTQQKQATPLLNEAVKQSSGGDPVMESILADTAKTTLQSMLRNEASTMSAVPYRPSEKEQAIVASSTPEELFGEESASRWASLAFSEAPSKKLL